MVYVSNGFTNVCVLDRSVPAMDEDSARMKIQTSAAAVLRGRAILLIGLCFANVRARSVAKAIDSALARH
jgi:hypothetical protein